MWRYYRIMERWVINVPVLWGASLRLGTLHVAARMLASPEKWASGPLNPAWELNESWSTSRLPLDDWGEYSVYSVHPSVLLLTVLCWSFVMSTILSFPITTANSRKLCREMSCTKDAPGFTIFLVLMPVSFFLWIVTILMSLIKFRLFPVKNSRRLSFPFCAYIYPTWKSWRYSKSFVGRRRAFAVSYSCWPNSRSLHTPYLVTSLLFHLSSIHQWQWHHTTSQRIPSSLHWGKYLPSGIWSCICIWYSFLAWLHG